MTGVRLQVTDIGLYRLVGVDGAEQCKEEEVLRVRDNDDDDE